MPLSFPRSPAPVDAHPPPVHPITLQRDLEALGHALDELARVQAAVPDHARVPAADVLLDRCRQLVASMVGDGGAVPGRVDPPVARPVPATPRQEAPEWHDWFMAPGVRSTRRRR